jgi:anhydro-N-acetylmuramic acid kinase
MSLYLGLMSGTSADGVTAALAEIGSGRLRVIGTLTTPYPSDLRRRVLGAAVLDAAGLARLNVELGEFFSKAARRLLVRFPRRRVAAVGSHGQTVWHGPEGRFPATLQIAEPAVLAERLGLTVVADFRPRDVAAGGQGAPLAPFLDNFLFGGGPPRALHNIGGIANVSVVGRGVRAFGFDTGPGNCLIDAAAVAATGGRLAYDRDGRLARRGRVHESAAKRLLMDPYFRRRPPKSADRGLFVPSFSRRLGLRGVDLVATATYFTALSIADQYRRFVPPKVRECVVSGGGLWNPVLMEHLRGLLPMPVRTIDEFGVPNESKEAAIFALLAERTLAGRPGNLPAATGARGSRILGKIVPA